MEAADVTSAPATKQPSALLQLASLILPIIKCAVCPACLSVLVPVLAGARVGLLLDERLHAALLLGALAADVVILGLAVRHHGQRGPLWVTAAGGATALAGHAFFESLELLGFGLLLVASLWNIVLLRQHRHTAACCAHEHS